MRKLVQLFNGFLIAMVNAKIVRAFPKTFRFRRERSCDGLDRLTLTNRINDRNTEVFLRAATSDWFTFDQIFINEDYDLKALKRYPEFEAIYAQFCADGVPLILDLGANIGLASVYFYHLWPDSKIFAVEPSEENFKVLLQNFAKNEKLSSI